MCLFVKFECRIYICAWLCRWSISSFVGYIETFTTCLNGDGTALKPHKQNPQAILLNHHQPLVPTTPMN